jgi:predicted O-methyltransferase YrrM
LYSTFQLAIKFATYYLTASNGKGHGVHSPFIFDFIEKVLNDKKAYACYISIESQRKKLLQDEGVIEVEDFGAGSSVIKTNKRVVKKIAASSLKPKKFAQLLFRIVQYYQPKTVVELGTSLGITSSYLATGSNNSNLYTCEGSANIAAIAEQTFTQLKYKNITLVKGDFTKKLPPLLSQLQKIDLAFVDGNHKKEPTINYFHQLLQHSTNETILIFDDIHWSTEMEAAWEEIKNHSRVTLTIDLFFIGLVFINTNFKEKQHFTIRF